MTDLRVFVDEDCDLGAVRAALACAESRRPKVECSTPSRGPVNVVDASWTRLDGPKQEAWVRMRAVDATRGAEMDPDERRAMVATTLRAAIEQGSGNDEDPLTLLRAWVTDLSTLSLAAALRHIGDGPPGKVDLAHAAAGTPWSHPVVERSAPARRMSFTLSGPGIPTTPVTSTERTPDVLATLDRADWDEHMADMPEIVLIREASFSRKGSAKVVMSSLIGSSRPHSADAMEMLRAHRRFRGFHA